MGFHLRDTTMVALAFAHAILLFITTSGIDQVSAFTSHHIVCRTTRGPSSAAVRRVGLQMMAGFGKASPNQTPKSNKPKSAAAIEREKAGSTFDSMKKRGVPEYQMFLRVKGDTSDKNWIPVGSMAVPRTSDVQTAVTRAIYESEEQLQSGAFRMYPKLKEYDEFEYGFRLVEFPDEEIRIARKEALVEQNQKSGMVQLFENFLLNPLNTDDQETQGPGPK